MYYIYTVFMNKEVKGKGYKTEQEAIDAVTEWLRICALNNCIMPAYYTYED